ncbi:MAG: alpha/beta hydrolase [Cyanobacteria bacterium P01_D01_bin.156]
MKSPLNPTLVLLPGLDGTGRLFSYFLEQFLYKNRIVVTKYPPDQLLDYDQLAAIVRRQLPKSTHFIIVAESFAGPIAARLIEHPQLRGIIFCASFLTPPQPWLLEFVGQMPLPLLLRFPIPSFPLRVACFGFSCPEVILDSFRETLQLVKPEVISYRLHLLLNINDLWRIRKSPVPLGYLKASADQLVPASKQLEIKRVFPPLETREITGSHFLLQTLPVAAKEAIFDLCASMAQEI